MKALRVHGACAVLARISLSEGALIVGESTRGMNKLEPREDDEALERFMAECMSEQSLEMEVGGEAALREEEKNVDEGSRKLGNPMLAPRRIWVLFCRLSTGRVGMRSLL